MNEETETSLRVDKNEKNRKGCGICNYPMDVFKYPSYVNCEQLTKVEKNEYCVDEQIHGATEQKQTRLSQSKVKMKTWPKP